MLDAANKMLPFAPLAGRGLKLYYTLKNGLFLRFRPARESRMTTRILKRYSISPVFFRGAACTSCRSSVAAS